MRWWTCGGFIISAYVSMWTWATGERGIKWACGEIWWTCDGFRISAYASTWTYGPIGPYGHKGHGGHVVRYGGHVVDS